MYGAGIFLAECDYIMFLDEDNSIAPDHVASLVSLCETKELDWAYSLRNILDADGNFVCRDDCESLGRWHTVLNPDDFLVDVNCYFLRHHVALRTCPIWYRKARDPAVAEVDRALCRALQTYFPRYETSGKYTTNYTVGNTPNSVQAEFFINGNTIMAERFGGKFPWRTM